MQHGEGVVPFIDSAERPHQRDGRVDHTGYRPQPAHALPGVEFFPPSSALYLTVRNFVMSRELRQLTAIPYPRKQYQWQRESSG